MTFLTIWEGAQGCKELWRVPKLSARVQSISA